MQNLSCHLDHSLRALQSTVVGSVCEQHKFLRTTEEQIFSYFEKKCMVIKMIVSVFFFLSILMSNIYV